MKPEYIQGNANPVDQPIMAWDDEMVLGNDVLDQTHHEFVALLNTLAQTSVDQLIPVLDECIAHTQDHFDLEETWMARLNFPAAGCHINEHKQVIGVMRQVRERVAQGETEFAYVLATELAAWLRIHATTMDYALTYFIESTGADVNVQAPPPETPVAGCGTEGHSC